MRVKLVIAALAVTGVSVPAAAEEPQNTGSEKRVCKKYVEIGSLVKGRKICKLPSQWQKERESAQKTARDMQTSGGRIAGPGG